MALDATFDPVLSRVRLAATAIDPATEALFERSTDGTHWTTVRGGAEVPVSGSDTASLDDYEFAPGVQNTYRVTGGADVYTDTVTPAQTSVWLKSITRPFLNRAVDVVDYSEIVRPARNGVFEVIGRSFPVGITDVRSSRRWTLDLHTLTVADADVLDLVFASGDPLYVQVPAGSDIPSGYVVVGDVTRSKWGVRSGRRFFSLPLTEVAAPGPDVVGSTVTWAALIAEFGTWADVLAEFGTWADVLEHVASPDVVIVP